MCRETGLRLNTNKCEIIMEDFSKLNEIDTFKDFIQVDKADMTLLGAPVLQSSAQDAAIKHKIDDLSRAIERLTLRSRRSGNPEEQYGNTKTSVPA